MEPNFVKLSRAIEETKRGNPNAYTLIVTTYMQKLFLTARSLCGNSATAEDLVQDTLIEGYLHLSDLREVEKIEGWLMRILKNKALNHLTRTPRIEGEDILERMADRRSPEMLYLRREAMQEWRDRINALSPALRQTAALYFLHNLSMEQIAQKTHTPLGTVKRRIHDARIKLKQEIEAMTLNKSTISDNFVSALSEKIQELENYTRTYGNIGFDSAYDNVKKLIAQVPDANTARDYSIRSAQIAVKADHKYSEEALAVYRQYGEVNKASWLLLDLCWKNNEPSVRREYTLNTIFPTLEAFPDSLEKVHALAEHCFWMAYYTDKTTSEGKNEARSWLNRALQHFGSDTAVDAMMANTLAALNALDCMEDERECRYLSVTGESYLSKDGNLYFNNQPGCNYANSGLYKYHNYLFYGAVCVGDHWMLPRTVPIEAGAEETMVNDKGEIVGLRQVIATDLTITTPAGTFENCLHLRKIDQDGDSHDTYYKEGVGIVKSISNRATEAKELAAYIINGGEGWLPLAVGNSWSYVTPGAPDVFHEQNIYTVEQLGNYWEPEKQKEAAVSLSCLNYFALEKNWENTADDANLLFTLVDSLCDQRNYSAAAEKLQAIVMANRSREAVDCALSVLEYLEEKLPMDEKGWRFCPSSANISTLQIKDDRIVYGECDYFCFDMGPFGTRGAENRIFGVKPFRYLHDLCGTLWSNKWVPGYTEDRPHSWNGGMIHLTVDEGGTVETPAGSFADTIHLTVNCEAEDYRDDYGYYFYEHCDCGTKEFWFAPGVGVVRFKCTWGRHLESDALLSDYRTIASAGEWMPIHIGNRWCYDEVNLTAENYIARRDYKVISGMSGRYLLADQQFFTYKGNLTEYDAFKASLTGK